MKRPKTIPANHEKYPASEDSPVSLQRSRLALAGIFILGAVLRVAFLGRDSLFFDELYVVMINKMPLKDMLKEAIAAGHLPLYHLVVRAWLLDGSSELWARSLSVIAGMAAIGFTYLAARELFSVRAGLWSAALVAVSPYLVWYSRAATFYAFFIALTTLSFYLIIRAARRGGWLNWAAYVLATLAVMMTSFFAAVLPVAAFFIFWLLGSRKKKELVFFLGSECLLFGAVPFIFMISRLAISEPTQRLSLGIEQIKTAFMGIAVSPFTLLGGWLEPMVNFTGRQGTPWLHLLIIAAAIAAGAAHVAYRGLPRSVDKKFFSVAIFTLLMVSLPLLLQVANQGQMQGRLYVWAVPFFMMVLAALLVNTAGRAGPVIAAAVFLALFSLSVWQLFNPPVREADWRQMMGVIASEWRDGDRLACFPLHNCVLAADNYLPGNTGIAGGMPVGGGQGIFFMAPGVRWTGYGTGYWAHHGTSAPLKGEDLNMRLAGDLDGAGRLWLISEYSLLNSESELSRYFEISWQQVDSQRYDFFLLSEYMPRRGQGCAIS